MKVLTMHQQSCGTEVAVGAAAPPMGSCTSDKLSSAEGGCRSTYGGGATKALAGSLFLDNCEVANNTANAGAGTEIAGATGYTSVVGISNTVISGNSAVLQGAAFNLGSTNGTTFTNVTFLNNVGECIPLQLFRLNPDCAPCCARPTNSTLASGPYPLTCVSTHSFPRKMSSPWSRLCGS